VPTSLTRTSAAAWLALLLICAAAICVVALAHAQTAVPLRNGLDPSFVAWVGLPYAPGEDDPVINEIAILPDGKIIIAGSQPKLIRLHTDGSIDPSFTATNEGNSWIGDVDLLPNGKMYLSTAHNSHTSGPRDPELVRINAVGLDRSGK
jgi:Domain of unknown function (DUF5122) beta-propeller